MEGSKPFHIVESRSLPVQNGEKNISKKEELKTSPPGSFKVAVGYKGDHHKEKVHRLTHSGGSNGRSFDLEDIASGSNGSHVTSTERACRVTVAILAAKDLKRNAAGPDVRDPIFKVKVEQVLRKSTDTKNGVNEVLYTI